MRLHHIVRGSGPTTIWLHGVLGGKEMYLPLVPHIHGTHYLLDARNHGQSPSSIHYDYDTAVADLEKFYTDQNLNSAIVIGHSLGGKQAMQFAIQNPQKVEKLILLDIAPTDNLQFSPEWAGKWKTSFDYAASLDLYGKTPRQVISELKQGIPRGPHLNMFVSWLKKSENNYAMWKHNIKNIARFAKRGAQNITPKPGFQKFPNPTLCLVGGDSPVTCKNPRSQQVFDSFANYMMQYKIEVIEGAAHPIVSDQPEALVKSINRFLGYSNEKTDTNRANENSAYNQ